MNNYSTLQSNYSIEEKNNYFLNNRTKSSNNNIYNSYYKFNTNFSNYINMNNRTKKKYNKTKNNNISNVTINSN